MKSKEIYESEVQALLILNVGAAVYLQTLKLLTFLTKTSKSMQFAQFQLYIIRNKKQGNYIYNYCL